MYICDDEVVKSLNNLLKYIDESCVLYMFEPIAKEKRLTLKDFPSEALKSNYNVIYRTESEYDTYFKTFIDNDFSVLFSEYYSVLGGNVSFSETDKIYKIFKK